MRRMERRGSGGERERRIEGGGNITSRRFATYISTQEKPFLAGSQAVNKALEKLGENPSMAFVVITANYDKKVVLEAIKKTLEGVPIIGVIVSDTIYNEDTIADTGVGVALWATDSSDITPFIIKGLVRNEDDLVKEIRERFESLKIKRKYTYLLGVVPNVLEGLSVKMSRVLIRVSEMFDAIFVGVVGDFKPSPWSIIYNAETYSDHFAFVIVESDVKFGTLLSYGFHPTMPFKVTSADDSVIKELNDTPVIDIFMDLFGRRGYSDSELRDPIKAAKILSKFQVAVADPSKAGRFKGSIIQSLDPSGLKIMTDVSVNDTLWIVEANLEEMIESTRKGIQKALGYIQNASAAGMLIFENHMRIQALGDDVDKDKSALKSALGLSFLGIPTVGEIVVHPDFYSGAHSGVMLGLLLANRFEQP